MKSFHSFITEKKRNRNPGRPGGPGPSEAERAAAKGNTLLNYAGIKTDLLPFICDAAVSKQGKFTPGSHIPILEPFELKSNILNNFSPTSTVLSMK